MRPGGKDLHLVVTDSGLGGLAVCAEIERNFRQASSYRNVRLTYFNSWPEPLRGYNDFPDLQSRAQVFNRALVRMGQFQPHQILLACNTLSVLYGLTEFSRAIDIPVLGIIDAGVDLFYQALSSNPSSSIVLMGTRTTIESQVHRDRLVHKGIEAGRIVAVHCHGLAAAIEKDPDSSATGDLIQNCVSEACRAGLTGMPVYVGLCCTHYTYVADSIGASFERQSGQSIRILDPGHRLACCVAPVQEDVPAPGSAISVEVVSKVELYDRQRHAIAKRVESVSAITARALLSYARTPDLF